MRRAAIPAFLNPMQFTKIRFLGGKLGDAMAKEYEAKTVADMLWVLIRKSSDPSSIRNMLKLNYSGVSLEEMQRKFGDESIWVYNILRGIDYNPGE
jgi:DNA polymerase eta